MALKKYLREKFANMQKELEIFQVTIMIFKIEKPVLRVITRKESNVVSPAPLIPRSVRTILERGSSWKRTRSLRVFTRIAIEYRARNKVDIYECASYGNVYSRGSRLELV